MDLFNTLFSLLLHLDQQLLGLLEQYGTWVYLFLFVVIFSETGLIIAPFLPGDSLLFVTGTLAAQGGLRIEWMLPLLALASFLGDNTNYWVGHYLGPRVFSVRDSRWLNPAHLQRTQAFYDRHGGKTVFVARFLPILRTFAPFVAGIARMDYRRFLVFSGSGSLAWILLLCGAGYLFGNLPLIRDHLGLVIAGIILLSFVPLMVGVWKEQGDPSIAPSPPPGDADSLPGVPESPGNGANGYRPGRDPEPQSTAVPPGHCGEP
ncbi:membrane-associated protein [Gammaproteobacteria bacterium]